MAGNKWNPVEMRDNRYNQILHLVSAANGAEDFYSTEVSVCAPAGQQNSFHLTKILLSALINRPIKIGRTESATIRYPKKWLL